MAHAGDPRGTPLRTRALPQPTAADQARARPPVRSGGGRADPAAARSCLSRVAGGPPRDHGSAFLEVLWRLFAGLESRRLPMILSLDGGASRRPPHASLAATRGVVGLSGPHFLRDSSASRDGSPAAELCHPERQRRAFDQARRRRWRRMNRRAGGAPRMALPQSVAFRGQREIPRSGRRPLPSSLRWNAGGLQC